jgi:two-component system response regulator FixJ
MFPTSQGNKEKIRVYIVDDDDAIRESLETLLTTIGFEVLAFASAKEFLRLAPSLPFGCLVSDLQMPEMDGLELYRRLVALNVRLPVIVVTAHGDISTAVKAMRAGAVDFVEKPFSTEAILTSIRMALAERPAPTATDQARDAIRERMKHLSPREREVMDGMVAGHSNKVIAQNLSLSPRTVEIHRARVMDKMQAHSLSELVRFALAAGPSAGAI